jgi:cysteine desulfurase
MRVYFDNAATTPIAPEVVETMTQAMLNLYGNPSSIHADGRIVRTAIEDARKTIANVLHASIGEIFFTSGGTEANNMILKNAVRDLGITRIVTSPIEHHCVLHTVESLKKYQQIAIEFVKIDKNGCIDLENLTEILRGGTQKTLVSLMHANNEIGTMIDLEQIAQICDEHKALFHSDTVQTMGYYPINVSKIKIHFLTGAGHKFHGPKGVGFLYINGDAMIKPFIDGGSQERNMRGGTENVYGIIGMAKALETAYYHLEDRKNKILSIHNYLKNRLLEEFDDIQFIGQSPTEKKVENTEGVGHYKVLNVSFPPSLKSELLLFNLDISGISASGGSACSSGAEGGSHVLDALDIDPSRKCIRFSFSHYNTLEEVDYVVEKLKKMTAVRV